MNILEMNNNENMAYQNCEAVPREKCLDQLVFIRNQGRFKINKLRIHIKKLKIG